jgi:signal transduction histidine kinase
VPEMINVANIYLKQNNLTEARSLYKEVVKIDRQDNGVDYVISGVSGLGDIAMIKKNYKPAIANFKEALMLGSAHNMKTTIDDYMCRIGYAFFLDKQFDSANIYLNNAYHLAKASQDWKTLADAANYLSALYENEHNYPLALQYQRLYKSASDTIYNKEKVSSLNKLEVLYETARKEKQIVGLQADQAKKQLQLVKQNIWLLITAISLGFIIMAFVLFYRSSKKNRVIAKQRQQLQDKKINSLEQEQKVIALKSMLTGQEAERTRIAKDLHDGLGGLFSTIKMHLSTLQHENEHLKQNELFRKSYKLVDTASEDLRRIAHNMMPEVLMKLGLMHALDDFCNTINEKNSFHVSLLNYGMEKRLNIHTEIMLYRIVQELLNNIIKHAKATEAIVQFNCCKNHIDITVEDNGIGFVPAEIEDKLHAGLDIIKSRANYLNGTVSIDSVQGVGTTVMIAFETDNKTEL